MWVKGVTVALLTKCISVHWMYGLHVSVSKQIVFWVSEEIKMQAVECHTPCKITENIFAETEQSKQITPLNSDTTRVEVGRLYTNVS